MGAPFLVFIEKPDHKSTNFMKWPYMHRFMGQPYFEQFMNKAALFKQDDPLVGEMKKIIQKEAANSEFGSSDSGPSEQDMHDTWTASAFGVFLSLTFSAFSGMAGGLMLGG